MLAEFIAKIESLAKDAANPHAVKNGRLTLVFPPGSGEPSHSFRDPIPDRDHQCHNIASFVGLVREMDTGETVIFVSATEAVAVFDSDNYRACRAVLPLKKSKTFLMLEKMRADQSERPARDIVRLLTYHLKDAFRNDVADQFRRLEWTDKERQKNDKRGFGNDIEAQVAGLDELPDFLFAEPAVWQGVGTDVRAGVRIAMDVNAQTRTIIAAPYPDEIENALQAAVDTLCELLDAGVPEGVSVYAGSP